MGGGRRTTLRDDPDLPSSRSREQLSMLRLFSYKMLPAPMCSNVLQFAPYSPTKQHWMEPILRNRL